MSRSRHALRTPCPPLASSLSLSLSLSPTTTSDLPRLLSQGQEGKEGLSGGEESDDPDAADFWVPEWADEAKKLRRRKGMDSPGRDSDSEGDSDDGPAGGASPHT